MEILLRKKGVFLVFLLWGLSFLGAQDADSLLDGMDRAMVPEIYQSTMTMTTHRPGKEDLTQTLEIWYKTGVGSLMEVTAPVRSKGTRFLQKDDTLWLFSPRSGSSRPVRLSAKQAFQGSTFSNGDVSEPHFSASYRAVLQGRETLVHPELGSVSVHIIVATPKNDRATYGGIKAWILADTLAPLKLEYTAKSGLLFKRMEFTQFRNLAGRVRPTYYRMESLEEEGTYTTLKLETLKEDLTLGDRIFTESWLTR